MTVSNRAEVIGVFPDVNVIARSNPATSEIINITFAKSANKIRWADGSLMYTLLISNQTHAAYVSPTISDILDPAKIVFVDQSIKVNGMLLSSSKYNYNNASGLLTINLDDILPFTKTFITFDVIKK